MITVQISSEGFVLFQKEIPPSHIVGAQEINVIYKCIFGGIHIFSDFKWLNKGVSWKKQQKYSSKISVASYTYTYVVTGPVSTIIQQPLTLRHFPWQRGKRHHSFFCCFITHLVHLCLIIYYIIDQVLIFMACGN